ncbi:MAG: hypothetical protein Q7S09_01790 [bacterium]|nr:hypothetical protein [bacterium]
MKRKKRKSPKIRRVFKGKLLKVFVKKVKIGHRWFTREIVQKKNAAAFLVYDPAQDAVVLVSQIREAMRSRKNRNGLTTEVSAGHLEGLDIRADIAREASEELGASISENQIVMLNKEEMVAVSPGWTSELLALAFIELRPGQLDRAKKKFGLACEGERITRKFVPVSTLETTPLQDLKTFALVQWFLKERAKKRSQELTEDLRAVSRMEDRF